MIDVKRRIQVVLVFIPEKSLSRVPKSIEKLSRESYLSTTSKKKKRLEVGMNYDTGMYIVYQGMHWIESHSNSCHLN